MQLAQTSANPLDQVGESEIVDDYHRRALQDLDDQRLARAAAAVIGVPRAEVTGDRYSFVLHAPLELLARSALLPYVAPSAREQARLRIVALAAGYQASGPPVSDPAPSSFDLLAGAGTALARGIDDEDVDVVDAAAMWLGQHARPDEIVALLADHVVHRLSAAGHGNIYLALLSRTQPRGLPGQMLRHPARELGKGSNHGIRVPATRTVRPVADSGDGLLTALERVPIIGRPPVLFIAPMVEHAQSNHVFDVLVDADGTFAAPEATPFELLRFAAHAMLQGPSDQAPYGWTHCLTLSQAPLMVAGACSDPARAVFVASAYLAAHWADLGAGVVDLGYTPGETGIDLGEALTESPAAAAAAAWHTSDIETTITTLATSASLNHDAHRVKYTLACLDAAATDPSHQPLYLAAAASLNAWWNQRVDEADPLLGSVPVPAP